MRIEILESTLTATEGVNFNVQDGKTIYNLTAELTGAETLGIWMSSISNLEELPRTLKLFEDTFFKTKAEHLTAYSPSIRKTAEGFLYALGGKEIVLPLNGKAFVRDVERPVEEMLTPSASNPKIQITGASASGKTTVAAKMVEKLIAQGVPVRVAGWGTTVYKRFGPDVVVEWTGPETVNRENDPSTVWIFDEMACFKVDSLEKFLSVSDRVVFVGEVDSELDVDAYFTSVVEVKVTSTRERIIRPARMNTPARVLARAIRSIREDINGTEILATSPILEHTYDEKLLKEISERAEILEADARLLHKLVKESMTSL